MSTGAASQQSKQIRRREACRINQQRYLKRQRDRVKTLQVRIRELKQQKQQRELQLQLFKTVGSITICQARLEVVRNYAEGLLYGIGRAKALTEYQVRILRQSCSSECSFESQGHIVARATAEVERLWRVKNELFVGRRCSLSNIRSLDSSGSIIQTHFKSTLPITTSLRTCFPYMDTNKMILGTLNGTLLRYNIIQQLYLDKNNQIYKIITDTDILGEWQKLRPPNIDTLSFLRMSQWTEKYGSSI